MYLDAMSAAEVRRGLQTVWVEVSENKSQTRTNPEIT